MCVCLSLFSLSVSLSLHVATKWILEPAFSAKSPLVCVCNPEIPRKEERTERKEGKQKEGRMSIKEGREDINEGRKEEYQGKKKIYQGRREGRME